VPYVAYSLLTLMRELSDEALLHQLAGFLSYAGRGGSFSFDRWADGKDFAPEDRDFLAVAYMGASVALGLAS